MAASIYATPPPDLSSDDTALSDASNTSTLNNNINNHNNNNNNNNNNNHNNNNNIHHTSNNNINNNNNNSNSNNENNIKNIRNNLIVANNNEKCNSNQISTLKINQNKIDQKEIEPSLDTLTATTTTEIYAKHILPKTTETKTSTSVTPTPSATKTTAAGATLVTTEKATSTTTTTSSEVLSECNENTTKTLCPKKEKEEEEHFNNIPLDNPISNTNDLKDPKDAADAQCSVSTVHATTAAMAAFAAAANAALQIKWLESLNEAARKRRKQNYPHRLGGESEEEYGEQENNLHSQNDISMNMNMSMYMEENIQKMLQFKEAMQLLKQKTQKLRQNHGQEGEEAEPDEETEEFSNISQTQITEIHDNNHTIDQLTTNSNDDHVHGHEQDQDQDQNQDNKKSQGNEEDQYTREFNKNPYYTFCKRCGENFQNDIQLSLHLLQEHNYSQQDCTNNENNQRNSGHFQPHNAFFANNNNNNNNNDKNNINNNTVKEQEHDNGSNEIFNILSSVNVKVEQKIFDNLATKSLNSNDEMSENLDRIQAQYAASFNAKLSQEQEQQTAKFTHKSQYQQWPSLVPPVFPGFPFGPEADALSARGYLPLLGMSGLPGHPGLDSHSRPPLRIFNPEAYCDLCNKEFCNKYFLRKHKNNKHGIFDPLMTPISGSIASLCKSEMVESQPRQISQSYVNMSLDGKILKADTQLDAHQQLNATTTTTAASTTENILITTPTSSSPVVASIFCDICSKRFTNNFALWRHRSKAHEQSNRQMIKEISEEKTNMPNLTPTTTATICSSTTASLVESSENAQLPLSLSVSKSSALSVINSTTQEIMAKNVEIAPGFQSEYNAEQAEDENFTMQHRQLSPHSIQQARESNFSQEKLKSLGVLNPEAFCEICGIEYYSKKMLLTHKQKLHAQIEPTESELLQKQLTMKAWPLIGMPGMNDSFNLMLGSNETSAVMQQILVDASLKDDSIEPSSKKRIKLEIEENDTSNAEQAAKPINLETQDATLQNLHKLQCMIQQLKSVEPAVTSQTIICRLCEKEVDNLQTHIACEHKNISDDNFPLLQSLQQARDSIDLELAKHLEYQDAIDMKCQQCDQNFSSMQDFKQHICELHQTQMNVIRENLLSPERIGNSSNVGVVASTAARLPYTITPTSSYCEICNKELCNKYFMKTHMQRMHGIEIENGAQIGGVVCNICNKELCSKYFLRVHKQNTHGIVEELVPLPQSRQSQNTLTAAIEAQQIHQQQTQIQLRQQQQQQQQQQLKSENDFGRVGIESSFEKSEFGLESCPLCSRRFKNFKLMQAHLFTDHGNGEKFEFNSKPSSPELGGPNGNIPLALQGKPLTHMLASDRSKSYKCSMCPFSTPNYTLLYMHDLTHTFLQNKTSDILNKEKLVPDLNMLQQTVTENMSDNNEPTNLSMRSISKEDLQNEKQLSIDRKLAKLRTTADSPIYPRFQEITNQHAKPVSYALPKTLPNTSGENNIFEEPKTTPHQMQAFLLETVNNQKPENTDPEKTEANSKFVPAIIYLPVKEHCSGSMTVCFKLTPF